jgi:hypothetical protein
MLRITREWVPRRGTGNAKRPDRSHNRLGHEQVAGSSSAFDLRRLTGPKTEALPSPRFGYRTRRVERLVLERGEDTRVTQSVSYLLDGVRISRKLLKSRKLCWGGVNGDAGCDFAGGLHIAPVSF